MLEVICGSMFAGKSTELIRRLERASIARKKVVLLRPHIDNRYSEDSLVSHNGTQMQAEQIRSVGDLYKHLNSPVHVIGIDEAQFLDESFATNINKMAEYKQVIVTGLDMTYRAEPFGIMPYLMSVADRVDKLYAVCHQCGKDATRTQRLIDGKPAPFDGPTILVGALESYEARCRRCWEVG